jgi:hypothetical protein
VGQLLAAEGPYLARESGPFPVRAVWAQSRSFSGFFVRADSAIRHPRDIKPGARVVDMTYAGSTRIVDGLLAWAGLRKNQVAWVKADSVKEKAAAILEGKAAVAFGTPTSATLYEAEQQEPGIAWVNLDAARDPEGAERFLGEDPFVTFGPMEGVKSCQGVWGAGGTSLYITRAATDPGLVYHLARWLEDNWPRFRDAHEWNRHMTREALLAETDQGFIPCHDGLVQYLKEKGDWTPARERRQAENVVTVDRYCAAFRAALMAADRQGVEVRPDNPAWARSWQETIKREGLPALRTHLPAPPGKD